MEPYTRERGMAWLNKHWQGQKACPICRSNVWSLSDSSVEIREFHGGNLVIGGSLYPLFFVACNICGYTMFFNAVIAGLVSAESTQDEKTDTHSEEKKRT